MSVDRVSEAEIAELKSSIRTWSATIGFKYQHVNRGCTMAGIKNCKFISFLDPEYEKLISNWRKHMKSKVGF